MNSDVVAQAVLESAIEIQEARLEKTTNEGARARIQKRIEGLKNYRDEVFPESEPVEISDDELRRIFDKLGKKVYPEGRKPYTQT
jgi:hypothetical protein